MSYTRKLPKIAPTVSKKAYATVKRGEITFEVGDQFLTRPATDFGSFTDGDRLIILYYVEKNGEVSIKNVTKDPKKAYELIGDVVFPSEIREAFELAQSYLDKFGFVAILMTGPSGCGKTTYPHAWANDQGLNFYELHMSLLGERQDMLGSAFAENGTTGFRWSNFINAYAEGNHVILLDEINRADMEALNPIMSMTDFRRCIEYDNQFVNSGPNNMLVATANVGWQFTGTMRLDGAIENRFDIVIPVNFLSPDVESQYMVDFFGLTDTQAGIIAKVMTKLRDSEILAEVGIDLSTRRSFAIAKLASVSELRLAFLHGLINRVPEEARMETINAVQFLGGNDV